MNINDLRPARDFAVMSGCKCLLYGPPGSGKTPLLNTAPRPILLAIEPGLLSMKNSELPTWTAPTSKRIQEFFDWFLSSNEARNFDTLCIDSVSEMAQIYLDEAKYVKKYGDGRKQYGYMYEETMKHLVNVYFMQQKHVVAICKQGKEEGTAKFFPSMPGNALNRDLPHKYDFILHFDLKNIQTANPPGQYKAIQTQESMDVSARNRTGNLDFYELPDLARLFQRAMTN
jgi:hypothetical protein